MQSDRQLVSLPVRRTTAVAAVLAALASMALIAANHTIAQRVAGALLPDAAEHVFTRQLLRNMAIGGLLCCGLLGVGWRAFALDYAGLGHWVAVSSVSLYVAGSLSFRWYVNDDAGISFTYARNLAEGHGLVFNTGEPPLEGYSNPLWVFLLAGAHCCGVDIVWAAKALGLALGAACLVLVWRLVQPRHPLTWLALPLTATNAAFIIWTSSGLENSLHALLLTAVVLFLTRPALAGSATALATAALCLLVLSRPEGVLFAFVAAGYVGVVAHRRKTSLAPATVVLVIPLAVLLALTAFRCLYFGDMLPNTFYAKASHTNPLRVLNPFSGGWNYVCSAFSGCGWTLALVPVLLLFLRRQTWLSAASAGLAMVAGQLFFVISVGGDWMGEFRFIAPIVPIMSVLIALGLDQLRELVAGAAGWRRHGALWCTIPALLVATGQLPRLIIFAHHPTTPLDVVARIGQHFVELAREAGIENPTLLHHDAGGTSYVARIHLIDLGGLCDRTIARHWRDRETLRRYIFEERRPTFIYSASVFAKKVGLESFREFHTDYIPLPPPPSPDLDGYIRCVRADLYPKPR